MADASLELSRFGGRTNTDTGMLLTSTDIDRVGDIGLKSLLNVLSLLCFDEANSVPINGFPRDTLTTDHCKTTATGDLTFSVSTGWGLFYDPAASSDAFVATVYRPIVVSSALTGTLDANDANPRIDLVCLAPAWVDDQAAGRRVQDPGTGVQSTSSVNQRRRFGAAMQVVKGTAAVTPSAPSVPSGYIEVARALVPATTGAATWEDSRPVLTLGHFFASMPRFAVSDYVPNGGSDELLVSATTPASMAVNVLRGRASINGLVRYYKSRIFPPVTISAAHATLIRFDLIVAKSDGTIGVVTGTPGSGTPALPSNQVALALVEVGATVTSIVSGKITDLRDREPYDGAEMLQKNSVTDNRLSQPHVRITAGAVDNPDTASATVHLSITDADGVALDVSGDVIVEVEAIWQLDGTSGITTGQFGYGAGKTLQQTLAETSGSLATTILLAPGTNMDFDVNTNSVDAYEGRAWLRMSASGTSACTFTVRRKDATVAMKPVIVVRPISHPGRSAVIEIPFTT